MSWGDEVDWEATREYCKRAVVKRPRRWTRYDAIVVLIVLIVWIWPR